MLLFLWIDYSFWAWAGSGIYAFSGCIFGAGFILAGKDGLEIIKTNIYQSKSNEVR